VFPILQVGPLAIQLPGLFLLGGIWVGTWMLDREAPKHGVSGSALSAWSSMAWSDASLALGSPTPCATRASMPKIR
jgi:prolipoprotein diacylglyceryltransferase